MASEAITRNDLTAILNEVLASNDHYLQSWEYVSNVGSNIFNGDWVATDDGIIVMRGEANTLGGNAYWYVSDATLNAWVGQIFWDNANGTSKTTAFPVIKGHTYRTLASSAIYVADAFFYKFVLKGGTPQGSNPEPVTVSINSSVATGSLSAYKIGKLVVVSGMLRPIVTGSFMQVATLSGCTAIANNYIPIGGYAINTQELYIDANTNILGLSTTQANVDLKVNFSFVIQ